MEISSPGSLTSLSAKANTNDAVGISMLKKQLDIAKESASQLIDALPASNNPEHLGQNIDIKA